MKKKPRFSSPFTANINSESTANLLQDMLGNDEIEQIARETGFIIRQRDLVTYILVLTFLSCFGCKATKWIAELHRTYNRLAKKPIEYKPFHNQLRKKACPKMLMTLIEYLLQKLIFQELVAISESKLAMFDDILLHDGSTVSLKASLKNKYPGRFKKTSPAAAEVHVTLSLLKGMPKKVQLAPDKESEKHFRPEVSSTKGKLLMADAGYQDVKYFLELINAEGYFLIRGTKNIKPHVLQAIDAQGKRQHYLEQKELRLKKIPRRPLDLIIIWETGGCFYVGRLAVFYHPGPRNSKQFTLLHTNLPSTFSLEDIGKLYRLRWQIELFFKEWKSYANLHAFDTNIEEIAECLIWASLLTAIVKRTLVHSAELALKMYLSTERAASSSMDYFLDLISALMKGSDECLRKTIENIFNYFSINAKRANPRRDLKSGRLQIGLCNPAIMARYNREQF